MGELYLRGMGSKIVGVYDFLYGNGFRQRKYLISLVDYREVRVLLDEISEERDKGEKRWDVVVLAELEVRLRGLIGDIDPFYDLIVETGRFHDAIVNGGVLPAFFNGGKEERVEITCVYKKISC